jgi:hypothetical protein
VIRGRHVPYDPWLSSEPWLLREFAPRRKIDSYYVVVYKMQQQHKMQQWIVQPHSFCETSRLTWQLLQRVPKQTLIGIR